ncbi:MAG: hypothetical protein MZV70_70320 [Desulfobacterales bacterium]|nr:hypothetical protein [Desulfobacterales bacterium]
MYEPGVHSEGGKVSLTARLINARRNLAARTYELTRPAADLSSAEQEFTRGVTTVIRLRHRRGQGQRSNKGVSSSLDARLLVHEGMTLLEATYPIKDHPDVFAEILAKYERALDLDPGYALALWAMGNAYEARYNSTLQPLRDPKDLDRMCAYFSQAYAKNPYSPETNVGLGWANFNRGDFAKSFEFFEKALRLEPGSAVVRLDVGAFLEERRPLSAGPAAPRAGGPAHAPGPGTGGPDLEPPRGPRAVSARPPPGPRRPWHWTRTRSAPGSPMPSTSFWPAGSTTARRRSKPCGGSSRTSATCRSPRACLRRPGAARSGPWRSRGRSRS